MTRYVVKIIMDFTAKDKLDAANKMADRLKLMHWVKGFPIEVREELSQESETVYFSKGKIHA